jgi:hypothetical protein
MSIFARALLPLLAALACLTPSMALAQDVPDGRVSILRFIPKAEWAAIAACKSSYDVTAAKEAADTQVSVDTHGYSLGAGEVDWPAGCYWFAHTLSQKHTVLERGVSTGLPAGGSTVWKFPPSTGGVVIDAAATSFCRRAPKPTTSGQGTQLIGITLIGGGGPPDATSHGVWMCVSAQLTDVNISNFAGDGVHVDPGEAGNANIFRIYNGFIQNVGRYGIFEHGSDANAGLIVGTGIGDVGGACDADLSFLGNTHIGELCQSAGRGLVRANLGGVSYQCLDPACPTTKPGSNDAVWYPVKFDARYPAFVPGAPYLVASDYAATNPNARAVFLGSYSEEGDPLSDVRAPSSIQGDLGSRATRFSVWVSVAYGAGDFMNATSGYGSLQHQPDGHLGVLAVVGGGGANGDVVRSQSYAASADTWRLHWTAGGDLREDWNNLDSSTNLTRTGPKTAQQFGRPAAQPGEIALPRGVFVGGGGEARYVGVGPAMPTKGAFAKGDRVFNSDPRVLGKPGAQYTVTGWLRLTTGEGHALNKDWVEMRELTGT